MAPSTETSTTRKPRNASPAPHKKTEGEDESNKVEDLKPASPELTEAAEKPTVTKDHEEVQVPAAPETSQRRFGCRTLGASFAALLVLVAVGAVAFFKVGGGPELLLATEAAGTFQAATRDAFSAAAKALLTASEAFPGGAAGLAGVAAAGSVLVLALSVTASRCSAQRRAARRTVVLAEAEKKSE